MHTAVLRGADPKGLEDSLNPWRKGGLSYAERLHEVQHSRIPLYLELVRYIEVSVASHSVTY